MIKIKESVQSVSDSVNMGVRSIFTAYLFSKFYYIGVKDDVILKLVNEL